MAQAARSMPQALKLAETVLAQLLNRYPPWSSRCMRYPGYRCGHAPVCMRCTFFIGYIPCVCMCLASVHLCQPV